MFYLCLPVDRGEARARKLFMLSSATFQMDFIYATLTFMSPKKTTSSDGIVNIIKTGFRTKERGSEAKAQE